LVLRPCEPSASAANARTCLLSPPGGLGVIELGCVAGDAATAAATRVVSRLGRG